MGKPNRSESLPARAVHALELARQSFSERAWERAFAHFSAVLRDSAQACELELDDLEQAAVAAALTGRDTEFLAGLERLHAAALAAGRAPRAGAGGRRGAG